MSKNLTQRVIVAVIAIPLILWICYQSGRYLQGLLLLFTALGAFEYFKATFSLSTKDSGAERLGALALPVAVSWIFSVGIAATHLEWGPANAALLFIGYALIIGLLLAVRSEAPRDLFLAQVSLCWGVFYVSLLYPFLYHIRETGAEGFDWILLTLGAIWVGDSAAMWVGSQFGKRKLAPSVSPNKTVEGFLGGLMSAVVVGLAFGLTVFKTTSPALVAGGALIVSLVGQLGDLVESMWKRSVEIKDSSSIIPGHGGVLDRFDSLAFAAPALYAYLLIISRWS